MTTVCELGCQKCQASSGVCSACQSGFTLSSTDSTKCNPPTSSTNTGTVCPDGSFANGGSCTQCDATCSTCSGGTANDCVVCSSGKYKFNGTCVSTDANGVCQTGLATSNGFVGDNNKKECEACPDKCTSCGIPAFSIASTIDQVQCTGCVPGFVLNNGSCVESCPSGTFLDPKDNITCTACDSSCGTCAGSSTFCLTCSSNKLASGGACVTSCSSNTFSSSGACVACHPDCATCSGGAFNQCSTCPSNRPVLSNGRCLPTCSKSEYFDSSSASCKACDGSCSSCSGAGSSSCLSCSDGNSVLRGGQCATASCTSDTSVVSGLGACLSDLVAIPAPDTTATGSAALPTLTGLDSPTNTKSSSGLEWWQILLMALGCAFVVLCLLLCWRRRMRKKRAAKTREFAKKRKLDDALTWRERVVRFGERLFGHSIGERALGNRRKARTGPIALQDGDVENHGGMVEMRDVEAGRGRQRSEMDVNRLLDSYARAPSTQARSMTTYDPRSSYYPPGYRPSRRDNDFDAKSRKSSWKSLSLRHHHDRAHDSEKTRQRDGQRDVDLNTMSDESMYTYLTGQQRRTADARQPHRAPPVPAIPVPYTSSDDFNKDPMTLKARNLDKGDRRPGLKSHFSEYTSSSYSTGGQSRSHSRSSSRHGFNTRGPTLAEEYASSIRTRDDYERYQERQFNRSRSRSPLGGPATDYGLVDVGETNAGGNGYGVQYGYGYREPQQNQQLESWLRPAYTGGSNGSASKNPFRR
jgi:hypothetical protein